LSRTIQPGSWGVLNNAGRNLNKKPEAEDNESLLLSVFDNLNNLYEKLNRLNYLVQRKDIEKIIYRKSTGNQNEDQYEIKQ